MDKHQKQIFNLYTLAIGLENHFRFKIVASLVYKKAVVGYGFCELKTHPFQDKYKKNEHAQFWHAETRAIFNALKVLPREQIKKCTLYICRVKIVDNVLLTAMAKPCCGCQSAINDYEINKVVYTNEVGSFTVMEN